MAELGLTPSLLERLKRIAKAENKTVDKVLYEAVLEYWVRFAARNRLPQKEW